MFIKAIETTSNFTRPIHSIVRFYGSADIHPGSATLFFVNKDGWALTCRRVAVELAVAEQLAQKYKAFRKARATLQGQKNEKHLMRRLELQNRFKKGVAVEALNNFVNCVEGPLNVEIQTHPSLDIALLHFTGFQKLGCSEFPVFAKDDAQSSSVRTIAGNKSQASCVA